MKRNLSLLGFSLLVMLGFPWLAVTFAPGDAAMAICLVLFLAVDPFYSILVGILAGRDLKKRWFHPLCTALLFLAGAWLLFDMGEPAFLHYAGIYLLLGLLAMVITTWFHSHHK